MYSSELYLFVPLKGLNSMCIYSEYNYLLLNAYCTLDISVHVHSHYGLNPPVTVLIISLFAFLSEPGFELMQGFMAFPSFVSICVDLFPVPKPPVFCMCKLIVIK